MLFRTQIIFCSSELRLHFRIAEVGSLLSLNRAWRAQVTLTYHLPDIILPCRLTSTNQLKIMLCNSADCRYCSSLSIYVQAEITSDSVGWG